MCVEIIQNETKMKFDYRGLFASQLSLSLVCDFHMFHTCYCIFSCLHVYGCNWKLQCMMSVLKRIRD